MQPRINHSNEKHALAMASEYGNWSLTTHSAGTVGSSTVIFGPTPARVSDPRYKLYGLPLIIYGTHSMH